MCGIVGIYKSNGKDVSADIYDGLIQVQHRGQDASGISTWNNSKMFMHKDLGLVSEVFKKESLLKLTRNIGIGHVRYPTAGCDDVIESQPFYSANPVIIFITPFGISSESMIFANSNNGAGAISEAFITTVFPIASAGANLTAVKNI